MTDPGEGLDAQTVLAMVGADPRAALRAADAIVAALPRPRTEGDVAEVATAHRAAGLALRALSDPEGADARMRAGLALAERHGLAEVAAEIRMSRAYVLLELGRTRAALASSDQALAVLTGLKAARVRVIRALVLERSGRTDDALADYDAALSVIQEADDGQWEARLRHNRALLLMMQGDTTGALSDLAWSRQYDLGRGNRLDAADALCNMGVALGEAGDIPGALELFDRADEEWGDLDRPERWMCRADVLSQAGLADEAAQQQREAVDWLHARGWRALEAEARLGVALALLSGTSPDLDEIAAQARAARTMFRRMDRTWWGHLADYAATTAALLRRPTARDLDHAARVADQLADVALEQQAADLRLTAGRAAASRHDETRARTLLEPLAVSTRAGELDVRTRAWAARALLSELDGQARDADQSLRRAWDVVETQRSLVGATELRAGAGAHATGLVTDGWRLAVSTGSARAAFDWAERGRAAVLRYRPATRPHDPELARALARLRTSSRAAVEARMDGDADRRTERARRRAETDVVRLTRQQPGVLPDLTPVGLDEVRDRLDGITFAQLVVDGEDVWAVTVRADGFELVHLSALDPVREALDTVSFGQSRVLHGFGTESGLAALWSAALASASRLDAAVLEPIVRLAGDDELVLCPAGPLTSLPWHLLEHARDRQVRIAPSATVWCRAHDDALTRRGRPASTRRLLAVAGPGLDGASREVAEVVRQHVAARALTADQAQVTTVLEAAPYADVLHLSAHSRLRRDNPLFSTIALADGELTGYDLESLSRTPDTVVLAACRAGAGAAVIGDETLGLAWTLMGMGTSNVVAPLFVVPDDRTRGFMVDLHRGLGMGASAAEALASAQARADRADPVTAAVSAAFVAYGA